MAEGKLSLAHETSSSFDYFSKFRLFVRNDMHTDIKFLVMRGDRCLKIKAHKLVLSIWSPIFADMFFGPNKIQEDTVEVADTSSFVFFGMIKLLYGFDKWFNNSLRKECLRDTNFLVELYKLGVLYQIEGLQIRCNKEIASQTLDKSNVFQLMEAARATDEEVTLNRCINFLETSTELVLLDQSDPCDVTLVSLRAVLALTRVSFSRESELVKWVFAWASRRAEKEHSTRAQKRIRKILDDVLGLLDFTAMTTEEFGDLMNKHEGVLTESEGYKIFKNIVNKGCCNLPEWAGVHIVREYNCREQTLSLPPQRPLGVSAILQEQKHLPKSLLDNVTDAKRKLESAKRYRAKANNRLEELAALEKCSTPPSPSDIVKAIYENQNTAMNRLLLNYEKVLNRQ